MSRQIKYIKERERIDFVVDPKPLTDADKKIISEAIAHYKATGQKPVKKLMTQRTSAKANVRYKRQNKKVVGG